MRNRLISALVLLASAASASAALAQSTPNFVYGQVPTAAQWNAAFGAKQDLLGYTPVNRAGDSMTGRLVTRGTLATNSGFNLTPGTAPTAPVNGDLWTTTAGMYVRINGATVGPLVSVASLIAGTTGQIQYNNAGAFAANAGLVYDGTSKMSLGVAGTSVGKVAFANATSGSITLQPATGALGTAVLTMPAVTDTLATIGTAQTFSALQTFSAGLTNTGQSTINTARTVVSATGAALDDLNVQAATTTVTGTTTITNMRKVGIYQPTFTDASSVTVTTASTLYVDNAPAAAGSLTITTPWAIRVGAGNVSFPGTGNLLGTITSGTWNGSVVAGQYGGTGVANTGKTITLGASLTTTGAGAPTLAFSGTGRTYTFQDAASTVAALDITSQTMSGGVHLTAYSIGTVTSGTTTIDCGNNPVQYVTDGGAFTLAAPANDSSCLVMITNNGSAGAITFTGFTVGGNTGDALTTTNGNAFTVSIWRINGVAGYRVAAMQ